MELRSFVTSFPSSGHKALERLGQKHDPLEKARIRIGIHISSREGIEESLMAGPPHNKFIVNE